MGIYGIDDFSLDLQSTPQPPSQPTASSSSSHLRSSLHDYSLPASDATQLFSSPVEMNYLNTFLPVDDPFPAPEKFDMERMRSLYEIISSQLRDEDRNPILRIIEDIEPQALAKCSEGEFTFDLDKLSDRTLLEIEKYVNEITMQQRQGKEKQEEEKKEEKKEEEKKEEHVCGKKRSFECMTMEEPFSLLQIESPQAVSIIEPLSPPASPTIKRRKCESPLDEEEYVTVKIRLYDLRQSKTLHGEFSCPACHKCFRDSSNLFKHMRCHTHEKPYVCKYCGKCFAHSSTLKGHENIHTGKKPYQCDHPGCGKRFSNSSNLSRHKRVHTGEKPYKCKFCGRGFNQSSNRNQHEKIHTHNRK